MGIGPTETKRASEVLMQRYYQNAKLVTQINSLVMQVLADRLLSVKPGPPIIIDAHFQMVRDLLDVRDEEVFQRNPRAILECFLLQMQRSEIKGMLAAKTRVPILGVPVQSRALQGLDSLLSIVQMPKGIPVATFAIGEAGAANAALFAAAMLATGDAALAARLDAFRTRQTETVLATALPPLAP